jgi:hypothetical protein
MRRCALLLPDLLVDPPFGFELTLWDTYGKVEWDP